MKAPVKKLGIAVDIVMYAIMLVQMFYIFTGNTFHEIAGIVFFVCLAAHIIIKRKHIKAILTGKLKNAGKAQKFSAFVTCLLFVGMILLMLTSMGVSRLLFPWFKLLQSSDLHRYLAAAVLTLSAVHGGMHFFVRTKKKKRTAVLIVIIAAVCLALSLFGPPYINRHFRIVRVDYEQAVHGEKVEWNGKKPLVVYFTRIGNTDFDDDVDAVSGASLMYADGALTGSNELIADMLEDMLECDKKAITLTGDKYPSSYGATVSAASKEIKNNARPQIEPIDVSDTESIILVYPLWWGTAPPPVLTFLESADLRGKTVYLVATQGSSGFSSSTEKKKKSASGADVKEVVSIYCEDIPTCRDTLLQHIKKIAP